MKRRTIIAIGLASLAAGVGAIGVTLANSQTLDPPTVAAPAPPVMPARLSPREIQLLSEGLAAARLGDWTSVRYARDAAADPLTRRILDWRYVSDRDSPASFGEILEGLSTFQGWPGRDAMRRRAEQNVFDSGLGPQAQINALTAESGPLSGDGALAVALAKRRLGQIQDANAQAKEIWRTRALTPRAEQILRNEFSGALDQADHAARAESLLWRDDASSAARLAPLLSGATRKVVDARIGLQQRRRRGLQTLVDAAAAARPDDPGLLYDRARYIRRTGRPEDALPLAARIDPSKAALAARAPIAEERRLYVSRALRQSAPRTAYRLVSNHGLSSGVEFADAEWLAGWIALRFLNDPATAGRHFDSLGGNVSAPVSRARALYWRGEAKRAAGDTASALTLYSEAAKFDFTFYGQLAAEKSDPGHTLTIVNDGPPPPEVRAPFEQRELVRALRAVGQAGTREDFESIAFFLDDTLTTPAEHEMLSAIARESGFLRTAVRNAKAGLFRGIVAKSAAYPVIELPSDARRPGRPESALIHALIRQETEFDPNAVSSAGARGMMQLMPGTAQLTARAEGVTYDRARLLSDPNYNVTLGAAHVQHLLEDWNGSYILTIASYNAGPARARQWIEDFGDPRLPGTDPVDWIELVPFEETRNYIMRVMENVQVYRARLSGQPTPLLLEEDLKRGG